MSHAVEKKLILSAPTLEYVSSSERNFYAGGQQQKNRVNEVTAVRHLRVMFKGITHLPWLFSA